MQDSSLVPSIHIGQLTTTGNSCSRDTQCPWLPRTPALNLHTTYSHSDTYMQMIQINVFFKRSWLSDILEESPLSDEPSFREDKGCGCHRRLLVAWDCCTGPRASKLCYHPYSSPLASKALQLTLQLPFSSLIFSLLPRSLHCSRPAHTSHWMHCGIFSTWELNTGTFWRFLKPGFETPMAPDILKTRFFEIHLMSALIDKTT